MNVRIVQCQNDDLFLDRLRMDFLSGSDFDNNNDFDDDDDDSADLFSAQDDGAGLKSIFATAEAKNPNRTQPSLSYQGQKKKKMEKEAEPTITGKSKPNLTMAGPIVVESFVFDRAYNNYKPMGKAGLIITPTKADSGLDILVLYRSKQQTLASAQILPQKFRFDVLSDTFSSFVDARSLTIWSVQFGAAETSEIFSANLALAKYRSSKSLTLQILSPGRKEDNDVIKCGECVEFEASIWNVEGDLKRFLEPDASTNSGSTGSEVHRIQGSIQQNFFVLVVAGLVNALLF